jgi:hypothetical protein
MKFKDHRNLQEQNEYIFFKVILGEGVGDFISSIYSILDSSVKIIDQ